MKNGMVQVAVINPFGEAASFKIEPFRQMTTVMDSYGAANNCELGDIVFLLDGKVIAPSQTPYGLKLQNGDAILVVFKEQQDWRTLAVMSPAGEAMFIKIKQVSMMEELMYSYCNPKELQLGHVVFVRNGNIIARTQTPDELKLQDYDVIHVVLKEQQDWRTLDEHKIEKEFLLTLPAWCRVSLTVMHPGGAPRSFTIKKATTMENLMNSYCVINNCELDDIIFLLPNGDVVSPTQTPRELKLQDGDSQQSCTNNSRSTSLCYHHCQPLPKKFVRQWPIWP